MKAAVGDRVVVLSNRLDGPVRDGRVVEVRSPDGSPPYLVEWSDTGHTGLFFPGRDAYVEHFEKADDESTGASHVEHRESWRVDVQIVGAGDDTSAHAVLVGDLGAAMEGDGTTRRRPGDLADRDAGDEIAVARALRRLSDALLDEASKRITAHEGHDVHLGG